MAQDLKPLIILAEDMVSCLAPTRTMADNSVLRESNVVSCLWAAVMYIENINNMGKPLKHIKLNKINTNHKFSKIFQ